MIRPNQIPSLACAALCAAAILPARASDAPVIGVMTHFAQGWDPSTAAQIAEAGIRDVRDELYWQDVEAERGRFAFPARYDRYMDALRRAGITPLIELTFANKAYDGGQTPYTDEAIAAYARYGTEVLRHYGRQVRAVEIWNEYNGSFCTGPAAAARAETYARMAKAAYAAVKRERPDVLVAGCATAGVPLPYLEKLFQLGALDSMDAVSVHPYRYESEPEGIESDIEALEALILKYNHGRPKPVWVTEIGWGTTAPGTRGLAIDEGTQAAFLVRAYALLASAGAERFYWYLFRDTGSFATMGLVHSDPARTPKMAYAAAREMVRRIGGARFVRREASAKGVYCLLFTRDSGDVRVVWSVGSSNPEISVTGRVFGILGDPLPHEALVIGSSPVYVEGEVTGLPAPEQDALPTLADSARDFSGAQGDGGWSYGMYVGSRGAFTPLAQFRTTDWKNEWYSQYRYLSVTATDQHPARSGDSDVAAVRRWTAAKAGPVHINVQFRCGPRGAGVRVAVLRDGNELVSKTIGGTFEPTARFETELELEPGDAVDFAVYPGPGGSIAYAATEVSAVVKEGRAP